MKRENLNDIKKEVADMFGVELSYFYEKGDHRDAKKAFIFVARTCGYMFKEIVEFLSSSVQNANILYFSACEKMDLDKSFNRKMKEIL